MYISALRAHASASALAVLCAALSAASPAAAQMYKWVDERGATTYSNTPPARGTQQKNLDPVAERVSVYTPDGPLERLIEEDRRQSGKVKQADPQPYSERQSAAAGGAPSQARERCLADRRVDCDSVGAQNHPELLPFHTPIYFFGARRAQVSRPLPPAAPYVEPRIGVDNRPPVGVDNRPPVGVDRRPAAGAEKRPSASIDERPLVGAPAQGRAAPLRR